MGKVKVGHIFCLTADILIKVLQKSSLSSPLPNMNSVQAVEFDWLPWQPQLLKNKKNIYIKN